MVEPPSPLDRLSGLVFGLAPFFDFNASLSLPTGEGDRFCDPSIGARSELEREVVDSEFGRLFIRDRKMVVVEGGVGVRSS